MLCRHSFAGSPRSNVIGSSVIVSADCALTMIQCAQHSAGIISLSLSTAFSGGY